MAIYLMNVYGHPPTEQWFRKAWTAAGKKLDMGKACVRFRKIEDVPLDVISEVIARTPVKAYIAWFETCLAGMAKGRAQAKTGGRRGRKKAEV